MTMKKAKDSELTVRGSQLPAELRTRFASAVDRTAEAVAGITASGWGFLSLRGGRFQLGETALGDTLQVVIVGAIRENVYYAGEFDPTTPEPPSCFALGYDEKQLAPPAELEGKQADACAGCWANAWGSGKGRGKACKNTLRLAVIPADTVTPAALAKATGARLRLPVTSVGAFAAYVKALKEVSGRPVSSVVTEVVLSPDPKTQYKVSFAAVKELNLQPVLDAVDTRITEAGPLLEALPDTSPVAAAPVRRAGRQRVPVVRDVAKQLKKR